MYIFKYIYIYTYIVDRSKYVHTEEKGVIDPPMGLGDK